MIDGVDLSNVAAIVQIDGTTTYVTSCVGINPSAGVPSDYGVRTESGLAIIIPRLSVRCLMMKTDYQFSTERQEAA